MRRIVEDPENGFAPTPQRTFVYAEELGKLDVVKNTARFWKDYFFEEAYALPGS